MSITIPGSAPVKPASGEFGELEQRGLEYLKVRRGNRTPFFVRKKLRNLAGAYLAAHTPEELDRPLPEMYDVMFMDEKVVPAIMDYPAGIDIKRAVSEPVRLILSHARSAIECEVPELQDRDVRSTPDISLSPEVREMTICHREYMNGVTRGNMGKRRLSDLEEVYIRLHNEMPESFPEMYDVVTLNADMLPQMISHPTYRFLSGHHHWVLKRTLKNIRHALHERFPELMNREKTGNGRLSQAVGREYLW